MLGSTVRDRITGFSGVVTGVVMYLTGCEQVLVAPPSKDGEFKDAHWFDLQRVEVDQTKEVIALDNSATLGPDVAPPKR